MGIKISNAEEVPALVYDNIHMEELVIKQHLLRNDNEAPIFELKIVYRPYAVDADGLKYYAKKPVWITMDNYLKQAMEEANQGNTALLQAFGAIQEALASIIGNTGRHGSTEVV